MRTRNVHTALTSSMGNPPVPSTIIFVPLVKKAARELISEKPDRCVRYIVAGD
jgi:hypothetical protein